MDKKKMEHGKDGMCMCGPMMGTTCMSVTGVLTLVGGLAFLLGGMGTLELKMATMLGGAMVTLVGLGFLVHGMKMCPMCKC